MTIEIVDLSMKSGGFPVRKLLVYQMIMMIDQWTYACPILRQTHVTKCLVSILTMWGSSIYGEYMFGILMNQ